MRRDFRLPLVPASFFGIVLGVLGLGNAWRAAAANWGVPRFVGELTIGAGAVIWLTLITLYSTKWLFARAAAEDEMADPLQCCFAGLSGVTACLVSISLKSYLPSMSAVLFIIGLAFTIGFASWRTSRLWKGRRDPATNLPFLYLPTVAGGFISAIGASAFGYAEIAYMAFGASFFSWLALESLVLLRLINGTELPPAQRGILGIQLAPPAVGALAVLATFGSAGHSVASAMMGYAILQALAVLWLLPWIAQERFSPGLWGYSFGATALANVAVLLSADGGSLTYHLLGAVSLTAATIVVAVLAIRTSAMLYSGKLTQTIVV